MAAKRMVVIGGDACGMSAASRARRHDPELEIEAFEMGGYTSYAACGMPYYVGGKVDDVNKLVVVTPEQFQEKRNITVHTRTKVTEIDPQAKTVEAVDLKADRSIKVNYDDLVLAVGAEAIIPSGVNASLDGVYTLRSLDDAAALRERIVRGGARRGLVVGAGYIGLEMAEALVGSGVRTSVMVRGDRAMSRAEPEISEAIASELSRQGVELITGAKAAATEVGTDGRLVVELTEGRMLELDLVVVGAGVKPRTGLARAAGLEIGPTGAIAVNRKQQTSDSHIYSGGDCAEAYNRVLGRNDYVPLALTANRQGRVIADNICGIEAEFPGILGTSVFKCFDLAVGMTGMGLDLAKAEGYDAFKSVATARSLPHYMADSNPLTIVLIAEKGTGRLLGAQMAGRGGVAKRLDTYATALAAGMTVREIHELDLAYAPPFATTWDAVIIAAGAAMKQV